MPRDAVSGSLPLASSQQAQRVIRLWDLPLRLFHWLLVAAVAFAIVTAKIGGEWMQWHGRAGIFIAGLLGFRLAWGFVGSGSARFAGFAPHPRNLLAYLQGRWRGLGHNPLGACSVFLLLSLLMAQVVTGLLGNDDIDFEGPWSAFIDKDLSDRITGWHHHLSNWLLALIGLHLAALAFYFFVRKSNLVLPMLTGKKRIEPAAHDVPDKEPAQHSWAGLAVSLGFAALAGYLASKPGWV
jgi:cytochrome b